MVEREAWLAMCKLVRVVGLRSVTGGTRREKLRGNWLVIGPLISWCPRESVNSVPTQLYRKGNASNSRSMWWASRCSAFCGLFWHGH